MTVGRRKKKNIMISFSLYSSQNTTTVISLRRMDWENKAVYNTSQRWCRTIKSIYDMKDKKPIGKHGSLCEENIKTDFK